MTAKGFFSYESNRLCFLCVWVWFGEILSLWSYSVVVVGFCWFVVVLLFVVGVLGCFCSFFFNIYVVLEQLIRGRRITLQLHLINVF